MSGRLGNYLELVRQAQQKRVQITREQEKEIRSLYREIARSLEKELRRYNPDSLTYRWLKDYAKNLRQESKSLFQEIRSITAASIQDTAEAVTEAERRFYTQACPALSERFSDVFSTIPQAMVEELMSGGIYRDFAGLSERIWDYRRKYDRDIQTILNRGIAQQKSAYDLAKDLERYLNPSAKKPWNWGNVYPGVNRVVDYNAQRLARTAVTHAYQLAFQRATQDNPFVESYRWHSSNSGRVCELCRERDGRLYEKDSLPLDHPNGMCVVTGEISKSLKEIGEELGDWAAGRTQNPELDRWLNSDPKNGIIQTRNIATRRMANGLRTSPYHILTDDEIQSIKFDARSLEIPEEVLRFNVGGQTGFSERDMVINIRGDILPDLSSKNLRDVLSQKAVLAHEYYGHYKSHPSSFRVGDWRDEFRASYRAAIDAPGLSDEERQMLILDAYDRAKEAGVSVRYNKEARRLLYGQDE